MKFKSRYFIRLLKLGRLKTHHRASFWAVFLILVLFTPNIANAGVFGYLSEFWELVVGATENTAEWFQSLGNAVAGAIGNVLLYPLKVIFDAIWTLKILFDIFYNIFELGFGIIANFFNFLIDFIKGFFSYSYSGENLITFDTKIIVFLKSIPLFTILLQVINFAIIFLMGFSVIKLLKHF